MSNETSHFDYLIAGYLKRQNYSKTFSNFLVESPNLRQRNLIDHDFENELSIDDFEHFRKELQKNTGAYSLLSQAVSQMENAVATMKYGLRLTNRRQNPDDRRPTSSMQRRFYNNSHSTISKSTRNVQNRSGEKSTTSFSLENHFSAETASAPPPPTIIFQIPISSTSSNNGELRHETTPVSVANRLQTVKEISIATTPTRRQLFSSPNSKRKTPNPKHQLTPLADKDLLDEALKQCSISPGDWDRRIIDSVVPEQLAAAINNARVNGSGGAQTAQIESIEDDRTDRLDRSAEENRVDEEAGGGDGRETDALVSGAMYQIGTNPDFFQSLEQLFAPEYNNDLETSSSAMREEINRYNDLYTPEPDMRYLGPGVELSPFSLAFNSSATSSTIAQFGDTPRQLWPTPATPRQSASKSKTVSAEKRSRRPSDKSPNNYFKKKNALVAKPLFFESPSSADDRSNKIDSVETETEPQPKKLRSQFSDQQQQQSDFGRVDFDFNRLSTHEEENQMDFDQQNNSTPTPATISDFVEPEKSISSSIKEGNVEGGKKSSGGKRGQESTNQNRYPSSDMITPERIDALMKRLHKKK